MDQGVGVQAALDDRRPTMEREYQHGPQGACERIFQPGHIGTMERGSAAPGASEGRTEGK